ncbi:MAG TPA: aspartate/glutamate racemase family protein [Syntrophales bacterium]|nr:aspartate/glutamate racemase family protein [Syntrophales bacterium]
MNAAAKDTLSLVIADSGMGGLSICADIVSGLQARRSHRSVSVTYFNAWPEQDRGYNLLPGMAERIRVFDRALAAMLCFRPDRILIACNTLSALYPGTPFSRQAPVPVEGIIDYGVDLIHAHVSARADSRVIILGTPTTIEAGTHRNRLVERGIDSGRIVCQPCDRLAGEIEKAPEGATVRAMVDDCIRQAADRIPDRRLPVAAALCCTHYGFSRRVFEAALQARFEGPITILDPNRAMSEALLADLAPPRHGDTRINLEVVSRIVWSDEKIEAIARFLEAASPLTAGALRQYRHDPDLFTF